MTEHNIYIVQVDSAGDFVHRVLSGAVEGKVLIIDSANRPILKALGITDVSGLSDALSGKIPTTEKAQANGVATLGSDGKVPSNQLPGSIAGAVAYQGSWDADTNDPTIPAAASGNKGYYYVVSVAGDTEIDGITDWEVGDWIISNGTAWQKVDNSEPIQSVNGKTGTVVIDKTDVGLSNVTNDAQLKSAQLDTDGGLTADSDEKIPSQKAVKTYADTKAAGNHSHWVSPPAYSNSTGTAGQIAYDDDYEYVCVATNKWKRKLLATFEASE